MGQTITVSKPLLTAISGIQITPAQRAAIWELAGYLDELKIPANHDDAVWITVPSKRLRGEHGRNDNAWLKELLNRMLGIKFQGSFNGEPWGAVLLAEYRFEQGGSQVKLLMPPTGLNAIRSPETFAKIDQKAVHLLKPHAQNLYGLLASKQWQNHRQWRVEIDELKAILGVTDKYKGRFNNFKDRVLEPAVEDINDFGVISLQWEAEKMGRSFHWITFKWDLKNPREAKKTEHEGERHSSARGKEQTSVDAPPLFPDETREIMISVTSWIEGCSLKETEEGIIVNGRSPQMRDKIRHFHAELCKATGKKVFIQ